jgi:tRNA G37 N-methylase TrmD
VSFLSQQTHGQPSGFSTDEKKALNHKLVGGNMYSVLHNQYLQDAIDESKAKENYNNYY